MRLPVVLPQISETGNVDWAPFFSVQCTYQIKMVPFQIPHHPSIKSLTLPSISFINFQNPILNSLSNFFFCFLIEFKKMNSHAKKPAVDEIVEEKSSSDSLPTPTVPTSLANSSPSTGQSPDNEVVEETGDSSAAAKDKGKGVAEPSRKRKHIITYKMKDGDGKHVLKIKRRRTDEDDNMSKRQQAYIDKLASRYEEQKRKNLAHSDLLMRKCAEEYYEDLCKA